MNFDVAAVNRSVVAPVTAEHVSETIQERRGSASHAQRHAHTYVLYTRRLVGSNASNYRRELARWRRATRICCALRQRSQTHDCKCSRDSRSLLQMRDKSDPWCVASYRIVASPSINVLHARPPRTASRKATTCSHCDRRASLRCATPAPKQKSTSFRTLDSTRAYSSYPIRRNLK